MDRLTLGEARYIHERILERFGGMPGLRDPGALASALAQPFQTFGGEELYPTTIDKVGALGFSIISNHPFVDGNKRVGYVAMAVALARLGLEIGGSIDEQESIILRVAAGELDREGLTAWLRDHVAPRST